MSLMIIRNGTIRQMAHEFILAFHSNYGAILYRLQDIYSELLVENREIFIPHLYLAHPQEVTPLQFREYVC